MRLYTYKAKLIRVIDSDTIVCLLNLGFDTHQKRTLRLLGFDGAETRTLDLEEKAKGVEQTLWMRRLLMRFDFLYVETVKKDNFGRYLSWVYSPDEDNINVMFIDEFPETRV